MTASLNDNEWEIFERISEVFALPESMDYKEPEDFNRLLRSRIPPRGKRFNHDHHDTCAYIARSKNANVVAYTANFMVPPPAAGAAPAQGAEGTQPAPADAPSPAAKHSSHGHHHATAPQKAQQLPSGATFVTSGRNVDCVFNPQNPIHAYFVNLEPSYVADRRKRGVVGDCDDLKMLERRFAYGYNAKPFDVDKHIMEQFPSHLQPDGRLAASFEAAALCGLDGAGVTAKRNQILGQLRDWWRPLMPMMGTFVALPVWPAILILLKPLAPPTSAPATSADEAAAWCGDSDTVPVILAVIDNKISILEKVYVKSIERWFRLPTVEYIEVFGVGLEDGKPVYEKQTNNGQYEPPTDVSKEDLAEALKN